MSYDHLKQKEEAWEVAVGRMLAEGAKLSEVLAYLKAESCSEFSAVTVLAGALGVRSSDAFELVNGSGLWQQERQRNKQLEDLFYRICEDIAEKEKREAQEADASAADTDAFSHQKALDAHAIALVHEMAGHVAGTGATSLQSLTSRDVRVVCIKILGWLKSQHRSGRQISFRVNPQHQWVQLFDVWRELDPRIGAVFALIDDHVAFHDNISETARREAWATADQLFNPPIMR